MSNDSHGSAAQVDHGRPARVWLIDAVDLKRIGCGDDVLDRHVLPLEQLRAAHRRRHGRDPALPAIRTGDTIFLLVERWAVVGSGRAGGDSPSGGGELAVDWDWSFGRRIPEHIDWVAGELEWNPRMRLFDRSGARLEPLGGVRRELAIELDAKDIVALIRSGEPY